MKMINFLMNCEDINHFHRLISKYRQILEDKKRCRTSIKKTSLKAFMYFEIKMKLIHMYISRDIFEQITSNIFNLKA